MKSFEQAYYEDDSFWAEGMVQDAGNVQRIERTISLVPDEVETLLDAGCGNGVFVHYLHRARPDIRLTCVDRSETALQYVRVGDRRLGDLARLPAEDNEVDCVSCLQVLEHLPVDAYDRAIAELARVSRRHIIVGVPYRERTERNVNRCPQCRTVFNVDLHLRQFDDRGFAQLFADRGFTQVQAVFPVKHEVYLGFPTWYLFRRFHVRRQEESFVAPICPVCGYRRRPNGAAVRPNAGNVVGSVDPAAQAVGYRGVGSRVRRFIKPLWPKRTTPGYWIVGLFTKA